MGGASGPIANFSPLDDGEDDTRKNSNGFRFRSWMNTIASTMEIWKNMDIPAFMFRELDRNVMVVEFFSSIKELIVSEEIHYNDLVETIDCKNGLTNIGIARKLNELEKEGMAAEDLSNKNDDDDDDDDCGNKDDPCVRLKRDCVGLLAAFKLKDPSKHVLIVANTHIYWDPAWIDVKLAQVKYLLSRLSLFKEVICNKFSCTPSVIVAGDFNSTPGDEVYDYITSTAADVDYSADHMRFCSLYRTNGGEPLFTNCTPDFTGTLDYIFFSDTCQLKTVSLLELPGPNSTDIVGGLPNHYHPSDHLPIGGEFELLSAASFSTADHLNDVEASLVEMKLKQ